MKLTENNISSDQLFVKNILEKKGPDLSDYQKLNDWFAEIQQAKLSGKISKEDIDFLRTFFKGVIDSPENLLGFSYCKPHGYSGDFEIIEKIYTRHVSSDPKYQNWDLFFHTFHAARAVCNRKTYFKNILKEKARKRKPLRILNLASGPCRDLLEFFEENPGVDVRFDCVELDKKAITYAKKVLENHADRVNFIPHNIFKFQSNQQYDLVWSAGLFDYFEDHTFIRILSRFFKNIKPGGEIIIGNVHPRNPTRPIMEFTNWNLHHRTESELVELAIASGLVDYSKIRIEQEPTGVNLFIRIRHDEKE